MRLFEPTRQAATLAKNELPLIPTPALLRRFPRGNPVSKFFRHIFEHSKLNRILGSQIVFVAVATSIFQLPVSAQTINSAESVPVETKTEAINFATQKGVVLPVKALKITQGYRFFHPGLDLDGITGDAIYSIMAGQVEAIQYSRFAYGNAVIIEHGNGVESLYAHLSKIEVEEGEEVNAGTQIGLMGSTGRSSGDHLHLEVRQDGIPINPLSILPRQ